MPGILSDFNEIWIFSTDRNARYFYPILTTFGFSQQIVMQVHNIKFYCKPSSGTALKHPGERTDMEVLGAFRDYAKAPTNCPTFVVSIRVPEHIFRIKGK